MQGLASSCVPCHVGRVRVSEKKKPIPTGSRDERLSECLLRTLCLPFVPGLVIQSFLLIVGDIPKPSCKLLFF